MDEWKPIGVRLTFAPERHKRLKKDKDALGLNWEDFVDKGDKALRKLAEMGIAVE